MINLLPEQEKRELSREYRRRLWIVMAAFCVGVITIAIILLVPSYLLSLYQEQTAAAQTATANKALVGESTDLLSKVVSLRSMISVLDAARTANKIQPTDVLSLIIKDMPLDDKVGSLHVSTSDGNLIVAVAGIAKTRESLVAFTDALKRESIVTSVDLPISNLASDSNIKFSFGVTAKM